MTSGNPISIREFILEPKLAYLDLRLLAGENGLDSQMISNPRIQKPGLALAGFLPYVKPGRIQILGESEYAFLQTLEPSEAIRRMSAVVQENIPAVLSTKGHTPPLEVLALCDEIGVPCIRTLQQTSDTIEGASAFLEDALADRTQLHGVLVDVFSHGTLIVGEPGIGKSECALELIYRGHRL
ncbi:MAG: HPr kinase/phosphorylase, partial [Acidobacteria bacterium]